MKKILISNIGNRNLKYRGEFIDKASFREKTLELLENYEQEKEYLDLNILDVLLDEKKDELEQVILFASDQEGGHNHQDTVYEAEIMARKIDETYGLPTKVTTLRCLVIDNNALLQNFRNILKSIIRNEPDAAFILCDSGGTAQQKSSLKIITEYLLPEDKFSFYHITEQRGSTSRITEVNQREYRRVIDAEQMIRLIEEGNYQAALSIHRLNSSEKGRDLKIEALLEFALYRKNHLRSESMQKAQFDNFQNWERKKFYFFQQYRDKRPIGGNEAEFITFIDENQYFYLCEMLSIAQFCYGLGDYNASTLYYTTFAETYFYAVIKELGYDFFGYDHENQKDDLLEEIENDQKLLSTFKEYGFESPKKALPTYLIYAKHRQPDDINQELIKSFEGVYSRFLNFPKNKLRQKYMGIDGLRNSLAHSGTGINIERLHEAIPGWEEIRQDWHRLLGLPEKNIFVQMNEAIIDYMK